MRELLLTSHAPLLAGRINPEAVAEVASSHVAADPSMQGYLHDTGALLLSGDDLSQRREILAAGSMAPGSRLEKVTRNGYFKSWLRDRMQDLDDEYITFEYEDPKRSMSTDRYHLDVRENDKRVPYGFGFVATHAVPEALTGQVPIPVARLEAYDPRSEDRYFASEEFDELVRNRLGIGDLQPSQPFNPGDVVFINGIHRRNSAVPASSSAASGDVRVVWRKPVFNQNAYTPQINASDLPDYSVLTRTG